MESEVRALGTLVGSRTRLPRPTNCRVPTHQARPTSQDDARFSFHVGRRSNRRWSLIASRLIHEVRASC